MSTTTEKTAIWKMICKLASVTLTFLFIIRPGLSQTTDNIDDSITLYDQVLSFQSTLPLDRQIAVAKEAEEYAKEKGNVYKQLSYATRRGALYFSLDSNQLCENLNRSLIPEIEEIVARTPTPEWKNMLVDCYSNLALSLIYREDPDSALRIYQYLYSRFENDSNLALQAKCLNGIGITFAYRSYIDLALKYFDQAQQIYEKINDKRGLYIVCSNIGTAYLDQKLYRDALPYCTRAYRIAEEENYQGQELITVCLSLGHIHVGLDQHDLANAYFDEALSRTLQGNFYHLEGFVTLAYALNLYNDGRYQECLQWATRGLEKLKNDKKYSLQMDFLNLLSQCCEKMGNDKEALSYLRQAVSITDSAFTAERRQSLLQLELEYNNYRHEQERIASQNALIMTDLKAKNRMLWIVGLAIILLLLVFVFFFMVRHYAKVKKLNEKIQEDAQKQLQMADQALEQKNKELATNTLRFMRLNNLQNAILDNVKKLKTAFATRGKEKMIVCEIENLAKQIASEQEWKDFEFYFEQVDKDFLATLAKICPELTTNERHLCVLFNLGLSNRDVAKLTGRTLQSIGMAKFRLKNKLKLENSDDLVPFLHSIGSHSQTQVASGTAPAADPASSVSSEPVEQNGEEEAEEEDMQKAEAES